MKCCVSVLLLSFMQILTGLWSKTGDGDMMIMMVDECLAACCQLVERGLSLDPLLHCVLDLVTCSYKVYTLRRNGIITNIFL